MSDRIEALVNPNMLVWARRTAGFDVIGVAKRMKVKPEKIEEWESGATKPTVLQAIDLAQIYRRPLSAFYLEAAPRDSSIAMTDFRRLPGMQTAPSPALLFERRHAEERRTVMLELAELTEGGFAYLNTVTTYDDAEQVGLQIRTQLGIDWVTQLSWTEPREALNAWRAAVEAQNVLVFQTATQGISLDVAEARGFSISARRFPVIVLNGADSRRGRIFTLLHEYTHLLQNAGGICDLHEIEGATSREQQIEVFCNHAAGAALVPAPILNTHSAVTSHGEDPEWSDAEIDVLARDFEVSQDVILRRLLILGLTSYAFYERKRGDIELALLEYMRKQKEEGRGGPVPRHRIMLGRNGKPFTRQVLGAYFDGQITLVDASRFLDAKVKHIKQMETELY